MNKLFLDIESTGINPYTAEIITGYFDLCANSQSLKNYTLKSQVDVWGDEAAEIHKISKAEMLTYPPKKLALDNFCEFLSGAGLFEAILYANPNTEMGFLHYDIATIQMQLMNHLEVDRLEMQPFKPQKITSVYTMAKEDAKKGVFSPVKKSNGRQCFKQTSVYYAMFGEKYNAHDAKDDVIAMKRIYNALNSVGNNKDNYKSDQLSIL